MGEGAQVWLEAKNLDPKDLFGRGFEGRPDWYNPKQRKYVGTCQTRVEDWPIDLHNSGPTCLMRREPERRIFGLQCHELSESRPPGPGIGPI